MRNIGWWLVGLFKYFIFFIFLHMLQHTDSLFLGVFQLLQDKFLAVSLQF